MEPFFVESFAISVTVFENLRKLRIIPNQSVSLLPEQVQDGAISAVGRLWPLPVVPIEIQSCQKTGLTVLAHLKESVQEFKDDVTVNVPLQIKFMLIKLICYAVHIVSQCFGTRSRDRQLWPRSVRLLAETVPLRSAASTSVYLRAMVSEL